MAAFISTEIYGTVSFIGAVLLREEGIVSTSLEQGQLKFDGMVGEQHGGAMRQSCARVSMLYPKGTYIRNFRQISILSEEELQDASAEIGVEKLNPTWLGSNIVFKNMPQLSNIPPSSRLVFENGASIAVDIENGPCIYTAKEIAEETGVAANKVLAALKRRRGVVGSVEAEGQIAIGEKARLFIPNARPFKL